MRVYPECHIHSGVTSEVLDLLDVQSALKQAGDIGVPKLMSGNREVEGPHDLGIPYRGPQLIR